MSEASVSKHLCLAFLAERVIRRFERSDNLTMLKMVKLTRTKKIKLGFIIVLIALVGITFKPSIRLKVKKPFYSLFQPIQKRFETADRFLGSLGRVITNLNSLRKRLVELEREKLRLLEENAQLQQVERENESLRKALDMELHQEFKLELVRVIGKRLEQKQIVLGKGSEDGIKKGMPVVTSQKVVVGSVTRAGEDVSRVRLISHPETRFSAQLKDRKIKSEIKGQGTSKLKLDFIPQDQQVKPGQVVVTSALGGEFPPGLLVGEIKQVKQKNVKPYQVADVKPYSEFNNFLFVITDY